MLILCIGPDTFRAQRKANELEAAFKEKYDKSGSGVERLSPGKDAAEEIIERAGTISLFTPRRFLRTMNLFGEIPAAKMKNAARALSGDQESTIVVSVEEEMPKAKTLDEMKEVKMVKYEFPEESGAKFLVFIKELATELKVNDEMAIKRIAEAAEGDSWLAYSELLKVAAGGVSELVRPARERSLFDYSDAFLRRDADRYKILENKDDSHAFLATILSSVRSFLRVRDRATDGLHPYVAKKLSTLRAVEPEEALAKSLLGHQAVRSGLGTDEENILIL